jgi:hypothetical protein
MTRGGHEVAVIGVFMREPLKVSGLELDRRHVLIFSRY